MKKFLLLTGTIIFFLTTSFTLSAQDKGDSAKVSKVSLDFGADLVSRYIWRGQQLNGNVPNIQPGIELDYRGLSFGVWGSFSVAGSNVSQEVDLYLAKSFFKDIFTLTVTDYFFPTEFGNYKYFRYGKDSTGHVFEGMLSYNGVDKFPLTAMLAVNFYGADAAKINNDPTSADFNKKTGIQYSTYIEVGYPFEVKDVSLNAFMGMSATTPMKADTLVGYVGESGYYGSKAGVVNFGITASKSIKISKEYSLPLTVSLITNPQAQKIYFVFGMTF